MKLSEWFTVAIYWFVLRLLVELLRVGLVEMSIVTFE